jgi:hypothetical protein
MVAVLCHLATFHNLVACEYLGAHKVRPSPAAMNGVADVYFTGS